MPPILAECAEAECRDEPAEPEGSLGGEPREPEDDSDVWAQLGTARQAIIKDFTLRLKTAQPTSRRQLKDQRKSALAAATRKAKDTVAGRRKVRRLKRPTGRDHKAGGGVAGRSDKERTL